MHGDPERLRKRSYFLDLGIIKSTVVVSLAKDGGIGTPSYSVHLPSVVSVVRYMSIPCPDPNQAYVHQKRQLISK